MNLSTALPDIGLACGVDLVDVESFGRALRVSGVRMASICFTDREREDADGRIDRLATRWAVKEAVAKALGVGLLQGVGLRDVETLIDEAGAPRLLLHGGARQLSRRRHLANWAISVSHECGVAIALAIATQGDGPAPNDEEEHDG